MKTTKICNFVIFENKFGQYTAKCKRVEKELCHQMVLPLKSLTS